MTWAQLKPNGLLPLERNRRMLCEVDCYDSALGFIQ